MLQRCCAAPRHTGVPLISSDLSHTNLVRLARAEARWRRGEHRAIPYDVPRGAPVHQGMPSGRARVPWAGGCRGSARTACWPRPQRGRRPGYRGRRRGYRGRRHCRGGHGPGLRAVGLRRRAGLLRGRVRRRPEPGQRRARFGRGGPGGSGQRVHRGRHGHGQARAAGAPRLPAGAGSQVGHVLRCLLQQRRPVLGLLLRDQGRGPDHPGQRLRPRLPAPAGGAAARPGRARPAAPRRRPPAGSP